MSHRLSSHITGREVLTFFLHLLDDVFRNPLKQTGTEKMLEGSKQRIEGHRVA
jgi:hypothetical protein